MNVGVDAKWLIDGPISGRIVLQNILPHVVFDTDCRIFIFVRRKHLNRAKRLLNDARFHYVALPDVGPSAWINLFVFPFLIRRHSIDLVICQYFTPLGFGHKTITMIYDVLWKDFPRYFSWKERLYFDLALWSSLNCRKIITISKSEKNRIVKIAPRLRAGVELMYLAGQSMPDNCEEDTDTDQYGRYVLSVGRLNERKNLRLIITCLESFPDLNLVVVGAASHLYNDPTHLASDDLRSRIFFLGDVSRSELRALYKGAWVFCFPSFAEGFGLPPLEAMGQGCPVICSASTSLPEVCGDAALYIDPHDASSLVRALSQVDAETRNALSRLGREQAARFSWEKSYKMLAEIVRKDLAQ